MDYQRREDHRILAIDPTSRGLGFAVLEGAGQLIDWGTRDTGRADSSRALHQVCALLDFYLPDLMIVEDTTDTASRRRIRARGLIEAASREAATRRVAVDRVSRAQVLQVFESTGARTKNRIAEVIAEHFPELSPHVPPRRKPWMSEDSRMGMFDSVAFALVHYSRCPEVVQEISRGSASAATELPKKT